MEVRLESRAVGIDGNKLLVDRASGASEIQFNKLVLASGAREQMVPFPGWTTPGVLGVGGLHNLTQGDHAEVLLSDGTA